MARAAPTPPDRPKARAPRAGTRGFRAPEILLKQMVQTTGTCFARRGHASTQGYPQMKGVTYKRKYWLAILRKK